MKPTNEQVAAVELARGMGTRTSGKVIAGAGTGKTSTAGMIAEAIQDDILYLAFNKRMAQEAKRKMPRNVTCRTLHSLAYHDTDSSLIDRLDTPRIDTTTVAKQLGICRHIELESGNALFQLEPKDIAQVAASTVDNFCRSEQTDIERQHLGIPKRMREVFGDDHHKLDELFLAIDPVAKRYWEDTCDPNGSMPFGHNHYMKRFAMSRPILDASFVIIDEAQDLNGCALQFLNTQNAPVLYVGDPNQQIYEWNWAINALDKVPGESCSLTRSWRFGPAIADVANEFLTQLNADLRIAGAGPYGKLLDPGDDVDAVLCRTNGGCVEAISKAVQGGAEVYTPKAQALTSLVGACIGLHRGEKQSHPSLMGLKSWEDAEEYAEAWPDSDVGSIVRLAKRHGGLARVFAILRGTRSTWRGADVTVTTVHQSKGLEFDRVRLFDDFPYDSTGDTKLPNEELRLLYVAVTRAKVGLDVSALRGSCCNLPPDAQRSEQC